MSNSPAADTRIRGFSRGMWIFGATIVAIISLATFPRIAIDPATDTVYVNPGGFPEGNTVYPWLEATPREFTIETGSISGDANGGYFDLPADHVPLALTISGEINELLTISQGPREISEPAAWPERLQYLQRVEDVIYVVLGPGQERIWITAQEAAWTVDVVEAEVTPIADTLTGSGDAILYYDGDALSASITHDGAGFFRVTRVSPGTENLLAINDVDTVNTRVSWPHSGGAMFIIESPGGDWSVRINE